MSARDAEAAMHSRCLAAARHRASANNSAQANVFRLAVMVLKTDFPTEAANLMSMSDEFFAAHPNEFLEPEEVVRRGWIENLPHLKSMLSQELKWRI